MFDRVVCFVPGTRFVFPHTTRPFVEGLVKGEGVQIPVEVLALEVDLKAVGHLIGRGVDIALSRLLGLLQGCTLEYAFEV